MCSSISVLINCYNYDQYVEESIASVLAQTQQADEIIFVDDGSTDDSFSLAEKALEGRANVKLIKKENGGQLSAFEAGIAVADGDWLCFLDADDVWKPRHLEVIRAAVDANPISGMVFSQMEFFGKASAGVNPFVYRQGFGDLGYASLLNLAGWGVCVTPFPATATSAVAIHRRYIENLFPFSDAINFGWKTSADVPLFRGAMLNGARRYAVEEKTVGYRIHGQNAFAGNQKVFPGLPGLAALTKGDICRKIGLGYEGVSQLYREYEEIPNKNAYVKKFYQHAALCSNLSFDQRLKNWWRIGRS